ncbi:6-phosphogluconolactonase [Streptomyces alboniger]
MNSGTGPYRDPASRPGRRTVLGALTGAALAAAGAACGSPGPREPGRPEGGRTETASSAAHRPRREGRLFLGTYTSQEGGGRGIGLATYDDTTGRVTGTGTISGVPDPSYLALHPSGRTLYAVDEREKGGVTAVALSADGGHEVLGTRGTGGAAPCHLSVHPSGRWLLSANYGSGSVAVHPIDASGALGERTDLVEHTAPPPGPGQDGPHAHQVRTSPDGRHVLAVDLGTDTVYTYRLDTGAGTLRQVSYARLRPGAGPRQLAFRPQDRARDGEFLPVGQFAVGGPVGVGPLPRSVSAGCSRIGAPERAARAGAASMWSSCAWVQTTATRRRPPAPRRWRPRRARRR